MRILSENKENVVTCRECECVYEYDKSDLLPILGSSYCVLVCPKCGQQMIMVYEMTEREADRVIDVEGDESGKEND